jgi:hypothetical protein
VSGINYIPPPTIERFMQNEALVRVIVGPVGSGKSMGCIMEILRRCRQQAPGTDNVRRTRWALIRNTMSQLRQTVLADIQQYLAPMVHFFVTDSTVQLRAPIGDGTAIHADLMMIPLDTKADVQRLLSMQLTGAWINEVREVPIDVVSALIGRLGRFPSRLMGGPSWFGLIADTNPWDVDSPYHERLVLNPEANWKLFHQPSGIGPYAENIQNLPVNYYENLMSDRDDGWSDVHVRSEWGTSNAGQAVFRRSFDASVHVRDMQAIVNPMRPVLVAMDFGRTPCALIAQVDSLGRLLVFEEVTSEDMGLHQLVAERLRPRLTAEPYVGKHVYVVADPAGMQRSQLREENAFDVLRQAGFTAYPAATNDIGPRLLAVEKLFRQTIGSEPAIQISRTGCPTLIRALASQYRYRRKRDGQLEDVPEKLHPWSDVADALQYACLSVNADLSSRVMMRYRPKAPERKFTAAAWT